MSTAEIPMSLYPDLPGFAKENKNLVFAMVEAGWRGRITSKGHWLGRAPDGKAQITVPAKNGNNRGLKNASASFLRWLRANAPEEERAVWDAAKTADPISQDLIADGLVRKQTQRLVAENMERAHKEVIEMIKSDPRIIIEPLVRPWLARKQPGKNGGTRYESEAVLERVWPEGNTDYACAYEGCGYTSVNPRGVAAHYGKAHTLKGESEPAGNGPLHPDPAYTEPTHSRDYRPTQRLVEALSAAMNEMYGTTEEIAAAVLAWFHERPDIEHTERPLVPLSDRQTLDRIRVLVGTPDPDQTAEIASLRWENTDLRRQRDEANEHLAKVQRDLDGIKELMEGVGR